MYKFRNREVGDSGIKVNLTPVLCCVIPIMEYNDKTLLTMTAEEESKLLLTYIKDPKLIGGLDQAKFLMAVSVLYSDWNCLLKM